MAQYVLVNRRSGMFTDQAKTASRASVATALGMLPSARVVASRDAQDPLARQVVLLDADESQVAAMRARLPADAVLEPAIRRELHERHVPLELQPAIPLAVGKLANAAPYRVTIKGSGKALGNIDVMIYLRDAAGQIQTSTVKTNGSGKLSFRVPPGFVVAFLEPIPYAGHWIMLAEAPPVGRTIECAPIAKPEANGAGWWHDVMNVDVKNTSRGKGVRVGVIDTGCGPHPNLTHVTLVGAFVDGRVLPPDQGRDVAEHGSHTTGIIGARPGKATDYAGIAPGCTLFHARVFKSEKKGDGPTQADLVNAIDALSRDHQCDLINMSLGGGPRSEAEEDAIRDALERGTLCICSAGNDGGPIDFPGAYAECQAVSAIGKVGEPPPGTFSANNRPREAVKMGTKNLFLAAFSSFGPTLACAAPGVGIVSTVPERQGFIRPYMEMDGTSMASPAACGALAVMLSKDAAYRALPRNLSRAKRAAQLLAQHCQTFALPVRFEGRGLPVV